LLAFAGVLHALDPQVDVRADDASADVWRDEARATWTSVRGEVPAARRPAVEAALAAAAPVPPARRALIHGDLGAEHVFVAGGRISGIIDWGDAALGDPAVDHGRLLRDVGASGAGGDSARLYAVYSALEDLAFGLETGDDRYRINALEALDELA
jgi:aminoglycoside phosphotransferase (APT) family kinase protein